MRDIIERLASREEICVCGREEKSANFAYHVCCEKDVGLDRVLRALRGISDYEFVMNTFGEIFSINSKDMTESKVAVWELGKPLHEQAEEVWERLTDILNK